MGARAGGGSVRLKEKTEVPWRALKKNKLGAVIFGCKHHTIAECLKEGLFGLPAAHYAYVKNVTPGLTLYLFNYSDRKLHGIYEAVSSGGMNISPYAWITGEGTEYTPYPAQVRIRELRKCRPLLEEEIKPIIAKNYYSGNLFWFELDKSQNRRLMELFSSSSLSVKMPRLEKRLHQVNATNRNMFDCLSNPDSNEIADEESKNLNSEGSPENELQEGEEFSETAEMMSKGNEYSSAPANSRDNLAQETKWNDLFKPSLSSSMDVKDWESLSIRLDSSISKVCEDATNIESNSSVVECWEDISSADDVVKDDQEIDRLDMLPSENRTPLEGDSQLTLAVIDYVLEKPGDVLMNTKEKERSVLPSLGSSEREHDPPNFTDRFSEKNDSHVMSEGLITSVPSSCFSNVIAKLMQEVEGLKVSQLNQCQKIERLEHYLDLSKSEIDRLKKICCKLARKASSDNCNIEDRSISSFTPEESVFIAGGFDDHSWLPELSLYSPCQDHVISLCSMSFTRTYAAMAKLSNELYIFGGTIDGVWCDRVESYNPISNQWVQRPSLKRRKASLAGASMHDNIYAIGGGNRFECFSEVELFDLNIGSWVSAQSMLEKRFSSAAADMNGALYVAGGYDGRDYLRSFERFDPRKGAWNRLGGMNVKRGCHSLVAFKEKLYAIGGYNGDTMVSSVEVFDPRIGSWVMEEAMSVPRAYMCSFVLGEKLYAFGGMQDDEVLDVMECYEENSGWHVIGTAALGKRSSCHALVL